ERVVRVMTENQPQRHKDTKIKLFEPVPIEIERVARQTVDAAFKVHSVLGPGLLESVYGVCLAHELRRRGLKVENEVKIPISYEGLELDAGLRIDLLVDGKLIVELKAVIRMEPVFEAQLLTYLKLTGHRLGLLINFNVPLIKDGIKRVVL
ncbi:MAG TPA: GxxExxY protein, partial [Blastocatellia bacterium]|nr:GxxExxY protein [Blastocatellia bacterium]